MRLCLICMTAVIYSKDKQLPRINYGMNKWSKKYLSRRFPFNDCLQNSSSSKNYLLYKGPFIPKTKLVKSSYQLSNNVHFMHVVSCMYAFSFCESWIREEKKRLSLGLRICKFVTHTHSDVKKIDLPTIDQSTATFISNAATPL